MTHFYYISIGNYIWYISSEMVISPKNKYKPQINISSTRYVPSTVMKMNISLDRRMQ